MNKNLLWTLSIVAGSNLYAMAQTQPVLNVAHSSPQTFQLNWASDPGSAYRLLYTPTLNSPIVWSPFEDIYAADANASVDVPYSFSQAGFFRLQTLDGSTMAVQICSPVNGQTVSGMFAVRIGADLGSAFASANVFLDGALIGMVEPGPLEFAFDTSHFPNGNHVLQVVALDSQSNETPSDNVTVNFQNSVRWLDAETLFQSFVPIVVQSDIFPANWTVTVQNDAGAVVTTISGTTSDGNISTIWDATDDSGNPVPEKASYQISIVVGDDSSQTVIPPVTTPPPPPPVTGLSSLNTSLQPDTSKSVLLPPLPPMPPGFPEITSMPVVQTTQPVLSAAAAQTGGKQGSSRTVAWHEAVWSSAEITVARQKITGIGGLIGDGISANLASNVRNLIGQIQNEVSGTRDVYGAGVMTVANAADWAAVQNSLLSVNPDVTAFYWYGHGACDGNSIAGFSTAKVVGDALGNHYLPPVTANGRTSPAKYVVNSPFNFVFIDGCMSGKGNLPEAFGIPKAIPASTYTIYNKHSRAFMGWKGKVTVSVANDDSVKWTLNFWNKFLETPDVTVQTAIDEANRHPIPSGGIILYGDPGLTWRQ